VEDNPQLYSPGLKWGVRPGSFTHETELFGPVLGVMKARGLHQAIELVNQTGYGLTSGLESLDDREQSIWCETIRAGNLYVNRPTTGAIVLRQPFGGFGRSAVGPGIKTGGPSYLAQLMCFEETAAPAAPSALANPALGDLHQQLAQPEPGGALSAGDISESDLARTRAAIRSHDEQVGREFAATHDHFRLLGQDNLRRYRPVSALRIRLHRDDSDFDLLGRIAAARALGCRITVSSPPDFACASLELLERLTQTWAAAIEFVEESDTVLVEGIASGQTDRIRYADPSRVPEPVRRAAAEAGLYIADTAVWAHGRLELLWYVREQSLSIDYHRYGNLGERAEEPRAQPL
jgi:RHH-type proline utilization regulon transcriptional repressor/proline dehydrogenase/delta 1-pyrroline-5-carboxylate dehydrogenase